MRVIALFKFSKALLLVGLGVGLITFLHKNVAEAVALWIDALRVDPNNRLIHWVMAKASGLTETRLKVLSLGSFCYAALMTAEGVGLWVGRRWGAFLTILATSVFLPVEFYELRISVTVPKVAVLIINVLIIWYLVEKLRTGQMRKGVLLKGK